MRDKSHRPLLALRTAVTEYIDLMRQWEDPDPQVMIQALWLITLDGAPNSGIPRGMSAKVLRLMCDVATGEIRPEHALELMKGWEHGQAD